MRTDSKQTSDGASSRAAIEIMSSFGSQWRRDIITGGRALQVDIYILAFVRVWYGAAHFEGPQGLVLGGLGEYAH